MYINKERSASGGQVGNVCVEETGRVCGRDRKIVWKGQENCDERELEGKREEYYSRKLCP